MSGFDRCVCWKMRLWSLDEAEAEALALGLEDAHAEDGWKAAARLVGQRIVVVFPVVGGVEEENVPCRGVRLG